MLGRLDVCLKVNDCRASIDFYTIIGFSVVEGNGDDGWADVSDNSSRIGIFEPTFMGSDSHTLNFRGGNVRKIAPVLGAHNFEHTAKFKGVNGGSIRLTDPDGHLFFVDSSDEEIESLAASATIAFD